MLEQSVPRGLVSFALQGDVDTASVPTVSRPLFDTLERAGCAELEVDCSGVTFIDTRGLAMMARAQRIADESGCRLTWIDPSPQLLEMLSATGVYEYLSIAVSP